MKKWVLLLLFVPAVFSTLNTQSTSDQSKHHEDVEKILLPVLNNHWLRETEQKRFEQAGSPMVFANSHQTKISPFSNGTWESQMNGLVSWKLIIKSSNALSLNLGFTDFHMPPSGRMFLSAPDSKSAFGPFTHDDNEAHGEFWSPLIDGDEVMIEVFVSKPEVEKLDLTIGYVNHDFTGFGKLLLSGSCNLDVVCSASDGWPEVDDYRDIIRSAGAYYFQSPNGTAICSGALVNNVREDCTPYFLTADHCGISTNNAASMVFVWNYQNSVCRQPNSTQSGQPGDGDKTQFNSGAILRANYEPTDLCLVEMDDPVDPAFLPFLAGWSAEDQLPASSICIHHPRVEEKRISFDYDAAVPDGDTHIRVLDWDIGTTEGGSSGSPLFNEKKQIAGQLTGGFAACGNDEYDSYGWVHKSWEGGGTPETRLKDWLDPDNTGVLNMHGKNCGFGANLSESFAELCAENTLDYSFLIGGNEFVDTTIHLAIISSPPGLNVEINEDSLLLNETAQVTFFNLDQLNSGIYYIAIEIRSGENTSISYFTLSLTKKSPAIPILLDPQHESANVHTQPGFNWERGAADRWVFQLATDENFENILAESSGLNDTLYVFGRIIGEQYSIFLESKRIE